MYIGVEELMKPESEVRLDYLLNNKKNNRCLESASGTMSDNRRPVLVPRFGVSGFRNQRRLFPEVLQHKVYEIGRSFP